MATIYIYLWRSHLVIYPERWGPLRARYEDAGKPRKMLAIDGGGIRGLLTLGMLQRMEKLLARQ